jgi:hypothetical protein
MNKTVRMKHVLYCLVFGVGWLFGKAAQAQEAKPAFKTRFSVGAGFTPEWFVEKGADRGQFFPTFGVAFEAQFTRRSGIEVGIYDRSRRESWTEYQPIETKLVDYPPDRYTPIKRSERGHWLSFRGGYKLSTEFLDLGAGLVYDLRLGQMDGGSLGYQRGDADLIGPYLTLSRNIVLYKGLSLELQVQVNPVFYVRERNEGYAGTFVGPGIRLKYGF